MTPGARQLEQPRQRLHQDGQGGDVPFLCPVRRLGSFLSVIMWNPLQGCALPWCVSPASCAALSVLGKEHGIGGSFGNLLWTVSQVPVCASFLSFCVYISSVFIAEGGGLSS